MDYIMLRIPTSKLIIAQKYICSNFDFYIGTLKIVSKKEIAFI